MGRLQNMKAKCTGNVQNQNQRVIHTVKQNGVLSDKIIHEVISINTGYIKNVNTVKCLKVTKSENIA